MCGIGGIMGEGHLSEELLEKMAQVLHHRGPDDVGYHLEPGAGLFNVRLSIIDVAGGHQPIYNEDGTICIVFNGEIYNHRELRVELEKSGHLFNSNSDTEVIVHLYEEYGRDFIQHLNGMFAIAIWDRQKQTGLVVRDRLGIKPLYYAFDSGRLIFASELKSILAADVPKRVSLLGLDLYLSLRYLPAESTMFEGIGKLMPGHWLEFQPGSEPITNEYWQPEQQALGSADEIEAQLEHLLKDAVRMRLLSDVPLGAFLSGGLDSSAIVGLMRSVSGEQTVKTFSIGFSEEARVDETDFARQVASANDTEHHEVDCTAKSVQSLPRLLHYFDEPFADPIIVPTHEVSALASEHVKVVLTGEGADELFGGYTRFRTDRYFQLYGHLPLALRRIIHRLSSSLPASGLSANARRASEMGRVGFAERLVRWVSAFDDAEREHLYTAELRELSKAGAAVELYSRFAERDGGGGEMDRMLFCDAKLRLPECMLARTDRMTMAVSIEGRTPFLDHRVAELALSIDHRLKIKGGQEKWLLKRALRKYVPDQILTRTKQGLAVPFAYWTRAGIEDDIRRILSPASIDSRGWFEPAYVADLMDRWRFHGSREAQQIWSILCLELWSRMYLDSNPLSPDTPLSEVD